MLEGISTTLDKTSLEEVLKAKAHLARVVDDIKEYYNHRKRGDETSILREGATGR